MAPPAGGPPQGGPPAGGAPGGGGGSMMGSAQKLAKLSQDAQAIASELPSTAPQMREIQNKVREATMQLIQQQRQAQTPTPQI